MQLTSRMLTLWQLRVEGGEDCKGRRGIHAQQSVGTEMLQSGAAVHLASGLCQICPHECPQVQSEQGQVSPQQDPLLQALGLILAQGALLHNE